MFIINACISFQNVQKVTVQLHMFTCFQYCTHTKSDDGIYICADNGELLNTVYKMIDYYLSLFWALKIKVYNDLSFYSTLHIQNFWLFLSLALS